MKPLGIRAVVAVGLVGALALPAAAAPIHMTTSAFNYAQVSSNGSIVTLALSQGSLSTVSSKAVNGISAVMTAFIADVNPPPTHVITPRRIDYPLGLSIKDGIGEALFDMHNVQIYLSGTSIKVKADITLASNSTGLDFSPYADTSKPHKVQFQGDFTNGYVWSVLKNGGDLMGVGGSGMTSAPEPATWATWALLAGCGALYRRNRMRRAAVVSAAA